MKTATQLLQSAVRSRDPILAGQALDSLRLAGNNKQCFRIALAADPTLTMMDVDDAESKG